jgi:hypothetical protein
MGRSAKGFGGELADCRDAARVAYEHVEIHDHGKWQQGKRPRVIFFSRHFFAKFLPFRVDFRISRIPLNIVATSPLTIPPAS